MRQFLIAAAILLAACPFFGQAAHRQAQVLQRGTGTAAKIVPFAQIQVCAGGTGGSTCSAPSIYSDFSLTQPITGPITSDSSGNYDYYLAGGCVDEIISSPGTDTRLLPYVCLAPSAAGTGVSSFSSGSLSPLFTTSVSNPTTTPSQSFALAMTANSTLFGNFSGATTTPSWWTLAAGSNVTLTPSGGNTLTIAASGGGSGSPGAPTDAIQVNVAGAFGGYSNFTYTSANGLRVPNVLIANQPQNMFSAAAYNTGGNTGSANGLATIFATSAYSSAPSSTVLMEPNYTEYDQSQMDTATGIRRSFLDLRQGSFHFKSISPGPYEGANQAARFDCQISDNPGSTYGGNATAFNTNNCIGINYVTDVPGWYYGFLGGSGPQGAMSTQLFNVSQTVFTASINKSFLNLSYFGLAGGDTQIYDENIVNGYGGGDKSADEGWHHLRLTETIGQEFSTNVGGVTDFPSQGYKQLWFPSVAGGVGTLRWLMDITTATSDTITAVGAGDGSGDVTLTMTGSSYPVSTKVTLATQITAQSNNFTQAKTATTFTVNTTTDLSVSNPLTPTAPSFQFVGNSSAECAQVTSYGAYDSGAHTQTITAMTSDTHFAGAVIYVGGMACRGLTVDADNGSVGSMQNGVKSMFYVFGSSANNQLLAGRLVQAGIDGSFIRGAVHLYQIARVLDVRPTPGNTGDDNFVKVEESGATWNVGDSVESGLIATALNDTFQYALTDWSPYSCCSTFKVLLNGSMVGGNGPRDFWYIQNETPDSAYTYDGGNYNIGGYLFHWVGAAPGIFNVQGGPLHGDFFQNFGCGYKLFNQGGNAFINSTCSGAAGHQGYDLQGDIQLYAWNGSQVATFTPNNINFSGATTIQGGTDSVGLIINHHSGLLPNIDDFVVNGTSTFNDNVVVASGKKITGTIFSSSINDGTGSTNCTAGWTAGVLGCNTGTITAPTFTAQASASGFTLNDNLGNNIGTSGYNDGGAMAIGASPCGYGNCGALELSATSRVNFKSAVPVVFMGSYVYGPNNGAGLFLRSIVDFGNNSSPIELQVNDFTNNVYQTVLHSQGITASGAKAELDLAPNGGLTTVGALLQLQHYTVSSLPVCAAGTANQVAIVTDATSPTYLGTLTAGGTVTTPALCNGTAWVAY